MWSKDALRDSLGGGDPDNAILNELLDAAIGRFEELALERCNVQLWWHVSAAEVLAEGVGENTEGLDPWALRAYDPTKPIGNLNPYSLRAEAVKDVWDACHDRGPLVPIVVDILRTAIEAAQGPVEE